jgi:protein-L-isoaspartate(D-aspartate) O-methyltransferase
MDTERTAMIDSQVRPSDVTDRRLIAALSEIDREAFVTAALRAVAYADRAIETAPGRSLWAARDFSKLANAAQVRDGDRVLDIAPGSGYSSAVFSRMGAVVTALEDSPSSAAALDEHMRAVGVRGVTAVSGPLGLGWSAASPYDVVFVNGAVEAVPEAWTSQLAEGGRLAVVVSEGAVRRARIYTRAGGKTAYRAPFESAAPVLPGFEKPTVFQF